MLARWMPAWLWELLHKSGRSLLLVGITALLVWVQQNDPWQIYSGWQNRLWNAYQRWGVEVTDHKPMTLVVQIDPGSINQVRKLYGEDWPWSRQRFAELLKILFEDYRVGVVGVDMFMPYSRDAEGNAVLIKLANQYPLVFSEAFDLNPSDQAFSTGHLAGGVPVASVAGSAHPFPQASGYTGLTDQLAGVPCVGHVTPIKDMAANGLVAKVPPLIAYQGRVYPPLVLEMLRCQTNGQYHFAVSAHENGWLFEARDLMGEGGTVRLVVDDAGLWRVPFRVTDIDAIPAIDVFQRKIPVQYAEALRNNMVILGGTAPRLGDQHPTPLSASVAGVDVHVQMLEWLLSGQDNSPAFSLDYWAWIAGFCGLAILYLLLMSGVGVGAVILAPLLMALAWLGLGFWGWVAKQWFVPMHPVVLFLAFLAILAPLEWWLARRTTGRLRKLFQDYLPAQLVGHIVNDKHNELLLPQKRCLTLLFADIANFTQRAERLSPEALADLTQQILERLTAVAHQHGGTVDKYMGDAVMVFWNAPFPQRDHADRGVAAALDMMAAIAQFNAEGSRLLQGEPIEVRIGVHTGDVVVGDLGTRFRHAYTAIGDAVNVTARLQTLARELYEYLVVSKQTVERLQCHWPLVSRGNIVLKGRKEGVEVYTLPLQATGT